MYYTGSERLIWAQGSPATLKAVSTRIRGVRVNLAAAICWENYMPLLRQALYAQNVNLWLAPTADGRDAWMGLMRTVALEGRCFVVSSNMCVRRRKSGGGDDDNGTTATREAEQGSTATITAATAAAANGPNGDADEHKHGRARKVMMDKKAEKVKEKEHEEKKEGEAVVFDDDVVDGGAAIPVSRSGVRRNDSCRTEDGFEIALPHAITAKIPKQPEEQATILTQAKIKQQQQQKQAGDSSAFISRGGSAIIAPDGEVLAGPQWEDDEGLIYADVDFEDCIRGRLDLDAAGSYSRNDSFKFSVEGLDLDPLPY
ncbi:hypothetical protein SLS62_002145 [Diatrype stigma]|uniref:CN hydrolase domain-containing protein n=1 Tax=Diatrype stigma TaxID=117547 RepID=A0AAN9UUM8_9PEZI